MRIAMLSVHACPMAKLGGRDSGGMNVYVRELARDLGKRGIEVDVYTRQREHDHPRIQEISPGEVKELFPLAHTDDILAGFYVAGDGRADPVCR